MNQGPWANLENDLGDLARVQGREVYIITGPAGNKGTLKSLGRVVIPTSTWKVVSSASSITPPAPYPGRSTTPFHAARTATGSTSSFHKSISKAPSR